MNSRAFALAAIALAAVALCPHPAAADTPTFNAIFLKPATGRNPYLMLHGTQTMHQLQFDAGVFFNYGYHPLQVLQGTTRVAGAIDHLAVADIVASIGATEWLQFGIDMPVILVNKFSNPQSTPMPPTQNFVDVGDLRVEAKARVLDSWRKPVGLAFVPFMTAPTGKSAHYVGDSSLSGGLRIALDGRVHPKVLLTFNTGMQAGKKVLFRNIDFQYLLLLGLGVNATLPQGFSLSAEINAMSAFNKMFIDRDMNPAEALVSANWDIKDSGVTVYAGGGTCLICGVEGARIRAAIGAKYRYNPEKFRQLDMEDLNACESRLGKALSVSELKELKMKCPPNPADYQPGVHDAACERYYELAEAANLILRCPSKAEDFNPRYHDAACPKVFNLAENYSPGDIRSIYELTAAEMSMMCPPNPGEFNAQLHDLGCPKYYDLKEVATLSQRCPDDPAEYVAGEDDAACPKFYELKDLYPENAWQAIANMSDQEMMLYGTAGISGGEIQQLRPIYFDFARTAIRSDAIAALDSIVEFVNRTPWIGRIRVGGNADARGSSVANEKIGQSRADAVVEYLRSHGTRSNIQFDTVSYGANRPAAPNTTEANRALNRRVIFIVTGWYAPPPPPTAKAAAVQAAAAAGDELPAEEEDEAEEFPATKPPARWQ